MVAPHRIARSCDRPADDDVRVTGWRLWVVAMDIALMKCNACSFQFVDKVYPSSSEFIACSDTEFAKDVRAVFVDCFNADIEKFGNFFAFFPSMIYLAISFSLVVRRCSGGNVFLCLFTKR